MIRKFQYLVALLFVLVLAACSTTPAPAPVADLTVGADGIVRPEMREVVGGNAGLEAQAETYSVTLKFVGNPPTSVKNALNAAKAKWQKAITQGVANINITVGANTCGSNPAFSGVVDDILIFGGVANIDGPGGILAQSGPCFIRTSNKLPIVGTLIFDSADVSAFSSQLTPIAIHEIGHSLGIGTIWKLKGLLSGAGTSNPRFTGANAKTEWIALGGTGTVPVENTGGSGTRDAHWRETTFANELMTGFINTGTNPLSRMSIASLKDLGYVVNLGAADSYHLP
jgi:Leishmanolysin